MGPANSRSPEVKRVWVKPPVLNSLSTQMTKGGRIMAAVAFFFLSVVLVVVVLVVSFSCLVSVVVVVVVLVLAVSFLSSFLFSTNCSQFSFVSPKSPKYPAKNPARMTRIRFDVPARPSIKRRNTSLLTTRYSSPPTGWASSTAPHPRSLLLAAVELRNDNARWLPLQPKLGSGTGVLLLVSTPRSSASSMSAVHTCRTPYSSRPDVKLSVPFAAVRHSECRLYPSSAAVADAMSSRSMLLLPPSDDGNDSTLRIGKKSRFGDCSPDRTARRGQKNTLLLLLPPPPPVVTAEPPSPYPP
mmetsp:Transcript_11651/g.17932  ORF Transcript_11651/g.17932 Transcript_11651/m.17932 type:complete len:299 (+) Transcript_11651:1242-2138(+)